MELDEVKIFLRKNIENLFYIYKNNECKSKTIKSIQHKIESIKNNNYLQKFIAECFNKINADVIKIYPKRKKINNREIYYYDFTLP